jgi:hypothetical protein
MNRYECERSNPLGGLDPTGLAEFGVPTEVTWPGVGKPYPDIEGYEGAGPHNFAFRFYTIGATPEERQKLKVVVCEALRKIDEKIRFIAIKADTLKFRYREGMKNLYAWFAPGTPPQYTTGIVSPKYEVPAGLRRLRNAIIKQQPPWRIDCTPRDSLIPGGAFGKASAEPGGNTMRLGYLFWKLGFGTMDARRAVWRPGGSETSLEEKTRTFLHELTHLVLKTGDRGYWDSEGGRYFLPNDVKGKPLDETVTLGTEQLLRNASTWEYFLMSPSALPDEPDGAKGN